MSQSGVKRRAQTSRPARKASEVLCAQPHDISRLRRKSHRITLRLHSIYGSPRHGNKDDPLDELIFIILSQMTTYKSFNRVFDRFKEAVGNWERILELSVPATKALIKDAGLSGQKAPRIKAIISKISQDFGYVGLDALRRMPDDQVEQYLTSLPGVGIKTAKCVMMYSLDRKVLPVDTHVWRVARRLGLVDPGIPYSRIHDALEAVVRPADRYSFHVNAVSHGQKTCLASHPRCVQCPLKRMCSYQKEAIP